MWGQQLTYTNCDGSLHTIAGVTMYHGYPWDYSFTNQNIQTGCDRAVEIFEVFFDKTISDPLLSANAMPTILIVFFPSEVIDTTSAETFVHESPFAQVDSKKLLHHNMYEFSYKRSSPPKIEMCYLEASIAATYYYCLKSALFIGYTNKTKYKGTVYKWEISAIENLKLVGHKLLSIDGQPTDISAAAIQFLEENPTKYSRNIILCSDVSPIEIPKKNYASYELPYVTGASDNSPFDELSKLLLEKDPTLNIWVVKSHHQLAKGAKLFAASPDMVTLPKHKVGF